jgi:tetratricopeptide (TPR) repeat protein
MSSRTAGQAVDPFYLARLEAAASLYEARRYDEAIKELEVAAFGLSSRKDHLARVQVLKALCYAKMGEKAKAAECLAAAAEVAGWEALSGTNVPEMAKADLARLVAEATTKTSAPPPDPTSAEGLKAAIRSDPTNPIPYLALATLYIQKNDPSSARKIYLDLLARNPSEIRGHLELGRLDYQARKLKNAERSLEKFLALAAGRTLDEHWKDEAWAMIILSSYLRGDENKTRKALQSGREIFAPARLAALTLSSQDINRLLAVRAALEKKLHP